MSELYDAYRPEPEFTDITAQHEVDETIFYDGDDAHLLNEESVDSGDASDFESDGPQTTASRIDRQKQRDLMGAMEQYQTEGTGNARVNTEALRRFFDANGITPAAESLIIAPEAIPHLDQALKDGGAPEGYDVPCQGRYLNKFGVAVIELNDSHRITEGTFVHEVAGHGRDRAVELLKFDPQQPGTIQDGIVGGWLLEEGLSDWWRTEYERTQGRLYLPTPDRNVPWYQPDRHGEDGSIKYGTGSHLYDTGSRMWDALFEREPALFELVHMRAETPADASEIQQQFVRRLDEIQPGLHDAITYLEYDHRRLYSIADAALATVVDATGFQMKDLNWLADNGNAAQIVRDNIANYTAETGYDFKRERNSHIE